MGASRRGRGSLARGNDLERRLVRYKTSEGFVVERARRSYIPVAPGKFISRRNDLFGAFDLLCLHPEQATEGIQVSVVDRRADKRKKVDEFFAAHPGLERSNHFAGFVAVWGRWKERGYGFLVERRRYDGLWFDYTFIESSEIPKR